MDGQASGCVTGDFPAPSPPWLREFPIKRRNRVDRKRKIRKALTRLEISPFFSIFFFDPGVPSPHSLFRLYL